MSKTVVVGMSGGVDSSVAALLLKNEGYNVIGVTIKLWNVEEVKTCEKVCCSMEDVYDAKRVCDFLNIPHYTVNFKSEFKKHVVDYFLAEYNAGNTPSPCIMCNETIKFGKMLDFALSIGAEYIATGHYADKIYISEIDKYTLKYGSDSKKDQTYMLYRLSSHQLKHTLFPLASYSKNEIRNIARENNLITFNKGDSQGICFVMGDYKTFLKNELGKSISPGFFIDKNHNKIGMHEGYQLYTIGQRRGLGLKTSHPLFIIDIFPNKNEILLGDFSDLFISKVKIINPSFPYLSLNDIKDRVVKVRQRFSSTGDDCLMTVEDGELYINYPVPNSRNARGQHAVFYDNNILLGGGIIADI